MHSIEIAGRTIGIESSPLVIAEIGINHEGDYSKAIRMVDDAKDAGCECVKFQCHVIEDEMVPNEVVPANASDSIWDIMKRCTLNEDEERSVKEYVESKGMIYLSTPFSRKAADRLQDMGVGAFKIGSGECNNYPLVSYIASFGKPMLISTGMNSVESIGVAVGVLEKKHVPYALMHCTSVYPT
ncbi:MAG: N-acetylneuraminate synthase family protein, partial [Kiritimatiellia bacterium]